MNVGILIEGAVGVGFSTIRSLMSLFTSEPLVYFVGIALVGAVAGVAREFVPMRTK